MAKAFFLRGASYLRYDTGGSAPDAGYPKAMADGWSGLGGTGFEQDVDTVLDIGNGKAYLFKGDSYLRVDQAQNAVDGEVTSIAEQWGGFGDAGFGDSLDAAVNLGNGKAYLFKGEQYIEYDIASDTVTNGAPLSIAADWGGFADAGFADSIDAAVNWGNGKVYTFKGDAYLRYDIANHVVDDGYPSPIAGNWGLDGTDFAKLDRRDLGEAHRLPRSRARPRTGRGGSAARRPRLVLERQGLAHHRYPATGVVPGLDERDRLQGQR